MPKTDKRRVDNDWLNSYILQILTKDSVTVFVNAIMYYKVSCSFTMIIFVSLYLSSVHKVSLCFKFVSQELQRLSTFEKIRICKFS